MPTELFHAKTAKCGPMSTSQDQRSGDLMTVGITTSLSQVDSTSIQEWFVLLAHYLLLLPLLCSLSEAQVALY